MNILEGSFNYVNSMNQKIYADTYTQGIILSLDDKKARIYDIGNLSFLLLSPSNMKDGKYQINENTNNFLTYYQRHNQSNRRDMIGRANVSNNYINTIDFTPQSGDILFLFSSERRTMYNNLNQKKNVLGMLYYELFEKAENMSNEKKESFTPLNPNDLDGVMNFLRDACRKENTAFIAVKFK